MEELVTFVLACIDEDERVARDAGGGEWHEPAIAPGETDWERDLDAERAHTIRHDPARVLREVESKRRILDEVAGEATGLDMQVDMEFRVGPRDTVAEPYLGDVLLRLLALPYADRPGYQEEWKP